MQIQKKVEAQEQASGAALETVDRLEIFLITMDAAGASEDSTKVGIAKWFDRFAQQAVEAERARIVAALEVELKALDGQYDDEDLGEQEGLIKAIAIAKGEEEGG